MKGNPDFSSSSSFREMKQNSGFSFSLGAWISILTPAIVFKNHHFRAHEAATVCHLRDSGFNFHAVNFVERGILAAERKKGRITVLSFATNPQKNPECFVNENAANQYQTLSSLPTALIPLAAASA